VLPRSVQIFIVFFSKVIFIKTPRGAVPEDLAPPKDRHGPGVERLTFHNAYNGFCVLSA